MQKNVGIPHICKLGVKNCEGLCIGSRSEAGQLELLEGEKYRNQKARRANNCRKYKIFMSAVLPMHFRFYKVHKNAAVHERRVH